MGLKLDELEWEYVAVEVGAGGWRRGWMERKEVGCLRDTGDWDGKDQVG